MIKMYIDNVSLYLDVPDIGQLIHQSNMSVAPSSLNVLIGDISTPFSCRDGG